MTYYTKGKDNQPNPKITEILEYSKGFKAARTTPSEVKVNKLQMNGCSQERNRNYKKEPSKLLELKNI